MAIVVRIPPPLQKFTKQQSTVQTTGATIQDMLDDLGRHFPGLREQLCDERGAVRRFVNLYLNDEDIRLRCLCLGSGACPGCRARYRCS